MESHTQFEDIPRSWWTLIHQRVLINIIRELKVPIYPLHHFWISINRQKVMIMSMGVWLYFYARPNFTISRIVNEGASITFNIGLGLPFIYEIHYNFWIWHVKSWKGKPSRNLTNINHRMRSFPHLSRISTGSLISTILIFGFLTSKFNTSKFIRFITSTLIWNETLVISSPLLKCMNTIFGFSILIMTKKENASSET